MINNIDNKIVIVEIEIKKVGDAIDNFYVGRENTSKYDSIRYDMLVVGKESLQNDKKSLQDERQFLLNNQKDLRQIPVLSAKTTPRGNYLFIIISIFLSIDLFLYCRSYTQCASLIKSNGTSLYC